MGRIRNIILLSLFALISAFAQGQNASAVIDRQEILIGEQAVISLSFRVDKNAISHVAFPTIEEELTDGLEVVNKSSIDTLETGQGVSETRLEQKVFITAWDTGVYEIPAFKFQTKGNTETTNPLQLVVQTVAIDTTAGIYGNRAGYEVQVNWWDYVKVFFQNETVQLVGLIWIILVIIGVTVYLVYRKRKIQETVVEEPVIYVPPHEIALQALQKLIAEKAHAQLEVKELHTQITDVLRTFVEDIFGIHAHEQTSTQIMNALRYVGIEEKNMQKLRTILFRADMVKFAKEKPSIQENENAIVDAIDFVKVNIPKVVEPEIATSDE